MPELLHETEQWKVVVLKHTNVLGSAAAAAAAASSNNERAFHYIPETNINRLEIKSKTSNRECHQHKESKLLSSCLFVQL